MINFLKPFLILLVAIPILISCNTDDSRSNCDNISCTEEFRTIIVSIKDENQNPVALDSFEVLLTENGNNIAMSFSTSEFEEVQQLGEYPLVNDASFDLNQEVQIEFIGFIDEEQVVNEIYVVSTDCCHINLVSGTLEIIL